MTTRTLPAPRADRRPFRVGPFARRRLAQQARLDAAATAQGAARDGDHGEPTTPHVQAMQAHAAAYARREEQRFFVRIDRELTEYRVLSRSLDTDLAAYDRLTGDISFDDRDFIANGSGPGFEELRRLERRITRGKRRVDELSALIHSRFTAAKLRANRYFDHADEKLAVYWGAYRRELAADRAAAPDRTLDRAPVLQRSDWLTTKENTRLLELWQGRNDAQA
ncbi:hypothetical protein ASE16_05040 [Leifsonia sp. Root227]|jgi:hypothetical protein|uniref:hypothetical protein n=1 Tax=unclassified Leifsonia TaxID=2663824 RepID=UPI0006F7BB30|nr:hypothetical protein [Leifsonia sp. Root227]KRC50404.1 hypothetical protein ASE16_05040 [Leifsonia sp. Root227]